MHELVYWGAGGLFTAAVLVRLADALPVPEFKLEQDQRKSSGTSASDDVGPDNAGEAPGMGKSFPSANFSSSDSLPIVEEIVGVDTSDLNLSENLSDATAAAAAASASSASSSSATASSQVQPNGGKLQSKENDGALGSRLLVEKALGLNDELRDQMKRHVKEEMARQQEKGLANMDYDEPISAVKLLEWVIFACIVVLALYALNEYTQGDFGRVLAGMFPKEAKALGLTSYLERRGMEQQQAASTTAGPGNLSGAEL